MFVYIFNKLFKIPKKLQFKKTEKTEKNTHHQQPFYTKLNYLFSLPLINPNLPPTTILNLQILTILHPTILQIIKINIRILTNLNPPPSPHQVTQHHTQLKLSQQLLHLTLDLCLRLNIFQRLLILVILSTMCQTITLNKVSFHLLNICR